MNLSLCFVAIGLLTAASAQTTWTGAIDGDWNKPGNWNNGVPSANDAFLGAGVSAATSAAAPDFQRLNLQNTTGKLTLGHAMTLQRLDDNHPSLVGNGTSGNMEILNGGALTITGDASSELLNLRGFSAISSVTVDGGTLTATSLTKRFWIAAETSTHSGVGATFTLKNGSVSIGSPIHLGSPSRYPKGVMNLDGGTFTYAGGIILQGNSSIGAPGGANLNINGATVLGTGVSQHVSVGANSQAGDYGQIALSAGALQMGLDSMVSVGPTGSGLAPPSGGRFVISGGGFSAPGKNTLVRISSYHGPPTSTATGVPTAAHGALHQSDGSAHIEGELRIGSGPPSSTTSGSGIYVHRGGSMTVTNQPDQTGLLRVAIKSQLTISGGTIHADEIRIDGPGDVTEPAGFLQGATGTLAGPLALAGVLSPGFQASFPQNTTTGTLNLHGGLTMATTATSFFDFKGTTLALGTYDSILNGGFDGVEFGGTLTLRFFGGEYQPGTVAIFDNFASYSGDFTSVTVTGLANGETATFDPANGTVTITGPPYDFAQWLVERGYTNPDPTDDPEGFGFPNLIRYALKLSDNPEKARSSFSHELLVDGRTRYFDLHYPKRTGLIDATVEVRCSRDLQTWLPLSDFAGTDTLTGDDGPDTELRRARVLASGEDRLFLRVTATPNP